MFDQIILKTRIFLIFIALSATLAACAGNQQAATKPNQSIEELKESLARKQYARYLAEEAHFLGVPGYGTPGKYFSTIRDSFEINKVQGDILRHFNGKFPYDFKDMDESAIYTNSYSLLDGVEREVRFDAIEKINIEAIKTRRAYFYCTNGRNMKGEIDWDEFASSRAMKVKWVTLTGNGAGVTVSETWRAFKSGTSHAIRNPRKVIRALSEPGVKRVEFRGDGFSTDVGAWITVTPKLVWALNDLASRCGS